MSEDIAINMEIFKESEGWQLISNNIQQAIDYRVDILL